MCMALVQKALKGDVRAFSKVVEISGPNMADELRAVASVSPADLDLLHLALNRRDEETNSGQAPPTVEPSSEGDQS